MQTEDQIIVLDIVDRVPVYGLTAGERKEKALEIARQIPLTIEAGNQIAAVEAVREMKRLTNVVETVRKNVKAPVIDLGKKIDTLAENYCTELNNEIRRIERGVAEFQRMEADRIRKEEEKLAQQQREAEAAAQRAIEEQERLANSRKKVTVQQSVQSEVKVQEALENLQVTRSQVVLSAPTAAGMKAKKVIKWTIENPALVYSTHPGFFELVPRPSAIKAFITKDMKIAGMTITEELDTKIRA